MFHAMIYSMYLFFYRAGTKLPILYHDRVLVTDKPHIILYIKNKKQKKHKIYETRTVFEENSERV